MMNVIHVVMDNIKMHRVTSKQVAKVTALKDLTFRRTKSRAKFVPRVSTRSKTINKIIAKLVQKENTLTRQAELRARAVKKGNTTTKQVDLCARCVERGNTTTKQEELLLLRARVAWSEHTTILQGEVLAKAIAALARTLQQTKLRVPCVLKEHIQIKTINRFVKLAKQEHTSILQGEVLAKTIAALARTLQQTKLRVPYVLKEHTQIKTINRFVKLAKRENTTILQGEVLAKMIAALARTLQQTKLRVPYVLKEHIQIKMIKRIAKLVKEGHSMIKQEELLAKNVW